MKCLMCEKEFEHKSRRCKIDKRRITCSKECAKAYRRVQQYIYLKIRIKVKKENVK